MEQSTSLLITPLPSLLTHPHWSPCTGSSRPFHYSPWGLEIPSFWHTSDQPGSAMVGINVSHSLGPHSTRGRDVHCTAGAARLVAAQGQAAGDRAGRGKPWPCGEAETGPGRQSWGLGRRQQGPAARTHRPRVTGKRLSISLPIYEIHHFVARGRGTLGFAGRLDVAKGGQQQGHVAFRSQGAIEHLGPN